MTESTPNTSNQDDNKSHKITATFIYALQASAVFLFIPALVAIIINHVKKDEVKGTWVESHFNWQIKTFWWSVIAYLMLFLFFGLTVLLVVLLGDPNFLVALPTTAITLAPFVIHIWFLYRVVHGWINLACDKPI